ncbi:MAG: 2OG-Fe(II) oxygenase [Burkholderiales bacterium]|nr:2OG-Fe(II) oxygenase [Burkholderiales bacterium]
MFNPRLNVGVLAAAFGESRRLQIQNVLEADVANNLHESLIAKVPWEFVCRRDNRESVLSPQMLQSMTPTEHGALAQQIIASARTQFQFAFYKFSMVDAYRRGNMPDACLTAFLESLASQSTIDFIRQLTGDTGVMRVDAQATLYDTGNFLKLHNDAEYDGLPRRFAYVLNLGRNWQPDWGGLLQFHDDTGNIIETFVPHFNSLSLFAVPALHSVSFVAPYALQPRLAITGWFTG